MLPDSRRSDITGFLFSRCSTPRFNCDSAITGHGQLFREHLQAAGDLGDLRGAILLVAGNLHELQVVDHDEIEAMLALHAPGPGTQLRRRQRRSLIDEDLGFRQLTRGAGDAHPVVIGDLAAAQIAQRHAADRRQHAGDHLLGGHFHAEDGDRGALLAGAQRGVLRHVDRERRLSHRGTTRDDDEIARPQATGHVVEVGEPGRQSAQLVRVGVGLVDLIDDARQHRADGDRALPSAEAAFGDLEHLLLGLVDELARGLGRRC